jgi:hypothetical protein
MNTSLKKQLKRYSALSSATITLINTANSQVVETFVGQEFNWDNESYSVDLDNNGVNDFEFLHEYKSYGICCSKNALNLIGNTYNQLLIKSFPDLVYPLNPYYGVDNSKIFVSNGLLLAFYINSMSYTASQNGLFLGQCDKYIGVKFDISGETHYGWIRVSVMHQQNFYISSWAYEAQPDTPIITPPITDKSATNIVVADIGNNEDASDIQISFDGAEDEHNFQSQGQGKYKIFLSKSATPPDVTSNSNFHEVTMDGSANYMVNLPSNFNDVDGNAIETNTQYYVYVFAVYSCEEYLSDVETISINGVVGTEERFSTPLELTIFPNPTNGLMEIISDKVIEQIEITDLTGKVIYFDKLSNRNGKLNVEHLSEGIYYLKATCQDQTVTHKKIVKK